jgi:hypothetical protein
MGWLNQRRPRTLRSAPYFSPSSQAPKRYEGQLKCNRRVINFGAFTGIIMYKWYKEMEGVSPGSDFVHSGPYNQHYDSWALHQH